MLIERNLEAELGTHADLGRRCAVCAVPTVVVDSRIKVEGVPDFPWFRSDELFARLEGKYPLR